ncbi:hypothetical protein Syun_003667 [Stephania yunnanensis]|uniref:Uncharacterized protein n=1 Tax=Stephania yunnanensis TaxID=152371 RepID=A0AAP0L469_9MAGN
MQSRVQPYQAQGRPGHCPRPISEVLYEDKKNEQDSKTFDHSTSKGKGIISHYLLARLLSGILLVGVAVVEPPEGLKAPEPPEMKRRKKKTPMFLDIKTYKSIYNECKANVMDYYTYTSQGLDTIDTFSLTIIGLIISVRTKTIENWMDLLDEECTLDSAKKMMSNVVNFFSGGFPTTTTTTTIATTTATIATISVEPSKES